MIEEIVLKYLKSKGFRAFMEDPEDTKKRIYFNREDWGRSGKPYKTGNTCYSVFFCIIL